MTPPQLANAMLRSKTGRPGRQGRGRGRPAPQPAPLLASSRCATGRSPTAGERRTSGSGPTRSPTGSPPTPAGPRSSCWSRWACGRRSSPSQACCGLTWITTGQLDGRPADRRRRPSRRCTATSPTGIPVIGLEPSCLAAIREDAGQLVDDPRVAEVSAGDALARRVPRRPRGRGEWTPPDLTGVEVVAQPHCHHHAVDRLGRPTPPCSRQTGADGHAGRRLLRAGRQLRRRAGPLRGLGGGGRARPAARRTECRGRTPLFWLTGSPAAPSSTTSPDGGRCTSPSCSHPRFAPDSGPPGSLDPCVWAIQACLRALMASHTTRTIATSVIIVPGRAPGTESRTEREPTRCPPSTSWSARAARTRCRRTRRPP